MKVKNSLFVFGIVFLVILLGVGFVSAVNQDMQYKNMFSLQHKVLGKWMSANGNGGPQVGINFDADEVGSGPSWEKFYLRSSTGSAKTGIVKSGDEVTIQAVRSDAANILKAIRGAGSSDDWVYAKDDCLFCHLLGTYEVKVKINKEGGKDGDAIKCGDSVVFVASDNEKYYLDVNTNLKHHPLSADGTTNTFVIYEENGACAPAVDCVPKTCDSPEITCRDDGSLVYVGCGKSISCPCKPSTPKCDENNPCPGPTSELICGIGDNLNKVMKKITTNTCSKDGNCYSGSASNIEQVCSGDTPICSNGACVAATACTKGSCSDGKICQDNLCADCNSVEALKIGGLSCADEFGSGYSCNSVTGKCEAACKKGSCSDGKVCNLETGICESCNGDNALCANEYGSIDNIASVCSENGMCVKDTGCTPKCEGKTCGADDGCNNGGKCTVQTCEDGKSCVAGECKTCGCDSNQCGGTDACGNLCTGSCSNGQSCYEGYCCTPACYPEKGQECGIGNCGKACGSCESGEICYQNNQYFGSVIYGKCINCNSKSCSDLGWECGTDIINCDMNLKPGDMVIQCGECSDNKQCINHKCYDADKIISSCGKVIDQSGNYIIGGVTFNPRQGLDYVPGITSYNSNGAYTSRPTVLRSQIEGENYVSANLQLVLTAANTDKACIKIIANNVNIDGAGANIENVNLPLTEANWKDYKAILAENVQNLEIKNLKISHKYSTISSGYPLETGIYFNNVQNSKIENVQINSQKKDGIKIVNGKNIYLIGNIVNSTPNAILVNNSQNVSELGNLVYDNKNADKTKTDGLIYGIWMLMSKNSTIKANIILKANMFGLNIEGSNTNLLWDNLILYSIQGIKYGKDATTATKDNILNGNVACYNLDWDFNCTNVSGVVSILNKQDVNFGTGIKAEKNIFQKISICRYGWPVLSSNYEDKCSELPYGKICVIDSDCGNDNQCVAGVCIPKCTNDGICAASEDCNCVDCLNNQKCNIPGSCTNCINDGNCANDECCCNDCQNLAINDRPERCKTIPAGCGDGIKNSENEECDEGVNNGIANSGCTINCKLTSINPPCPEGTTLCGDRKCWITCPTAPVCSTNCGEGSGCQCQNCNGQRDSCATGLICSYSDKHCCKSQSDGICATGCENSDPDCEPAVCGDGKLDIGELCDGSLLNNKKCSNFDSFNDNNPLRCIAAGPTNECHFDTNPCTPLNPGNCGNNIVNNGEECDGENINNFVCSDFGLTYGKVTCKDCLLDISQCTNQRCPTNKPYVCADGSCAEDVTKCLIDNEASCKDLSNAHCVLPRYWNDEILTGIQEHYSNPLGTGSNYCFNKALTKKQISGGCYSYISCECTINQDTNKCEELTAERPDPSNPATCSVPSQKLCQFSTSIEGNCDTESEYRVISTATWLGTDKTSKEYQSCKSSTKTLPCQGVQNVPFFGLWNLIIAGLMIVGIYFFMRKRR